MATVVNARPRVKTIYERYGSRLRAEFREIMAAIREGVVERDIFGLRDSADALAKPPPSFEFTTDATKVEGFMEWLRQQQRSGLLNVIHRDGNVYIKNAYSAGVRWAHARLREQGVTVPIDDIDRIFNMPVHRSTLQMLFTRNYEALKGITTAVSRQIARTLTSGFAQGWGPKKMARKLNERIDAIGLTRATVLARTETLHAHNSAAKRRYLDMGVETVGIVNHDPCEEICQPIVENGPYPINDIPDGGPPLHPNCMGSLYPVVK